MKKNIKDFLDEKEKRTLSPFAQLSSKSRGRKKKENESQIRTSFMRDRDRIVHCSSFRRLKHKAQVFLLSINDLIRTRLTHSLEVSQISRTIAKSLNLNEDLTEAIALGHDMGHPPFGHTGEKILNKLFKRGFRHNFQSLRIVDFLEKHGDGLNLTYEVRDGILKHSKFGKKLFSEKKLRPITLEGQIVQVCDRGAYINHDYDDAIRSNLIKEADLPINVVKILGESKSERINTIVIDIIEKSQNKASIEMSYKVQNAIEEARTFLFNRVYLNKHIEKEAEKAAKIISDLYSFYVSNPNILLKKVKDIKYSKGVSLERMVVDYISMMTDNFALAAHKEHLLPKKWFGFGLNC